jgi:hypothetical protein
MELLLFFKYKGLLFWSRKEIRTCSSYRGKKQRSALFAEEGNVDKLLVYIEKKNKGLPILLRKAVILYNIDLLFLLRQETSGALFSEEIKMWLLLL